jgi:hypothetical protein
MTPLSPLHTTLLPGARALLRAHARELPQRDDLCGAFCGALALRAAGIEHAATTPADRRARGENRREQTAAGVPAGEAIHEDAVALAAGALAAEAIDQDAVALAAGSVVAASPDPAHLPPGEPGRRDYRLKLALVQDAALSGTTAPGVLGAIERLSGGALAAIPYSGPWTATTLGGLFELAAAAARPVALIANLATSHLWGGRAQLDQMLDHLYEGAQDGPPPDWDVGHFVCVFGRVRGPRGALYGIADTYPALGRHGVHAQPAERLAAAIERRDRRETLASDRSGETLASGAGRSGDASEASVAPIGPPFDRHPRFARPAGGVLAVVAAGDAPRVRAGAERLGLREGVWDNGTVTR